jgi:hypothetical protein
MHGFWLGENAAAGEIAPRKCRAMAARASRRISHSRNKKSGRISFGEEKKCLGRRPEITLNVERHLNWLPVLMDQPKRATSAVK